MPSPVKMNKETLRYLENKADMHGLLLRNFTDGRIPAYAKIESQFDRWVWRFIDSFEKHISEYKGSISPQEDGYDRFIWWAEIALANIHWGKSTPMSITRLQSIYAANLKNEKKLTFEGVKERLIEVGAVTTIEYMAAMIGWTQNGKGELEAEKDRVRREKIEDERALVNQKEIAKLENKKNKILERVKFVMDKINEYKLELSSLQIKIDQINEEIEQSRPN